MLILLLRFVTGVVQIHDWWHASSMLDLISTLRTSFSGYNSTKKDR